MGETATETITNPDGTITTTVRDSLGIFKIETKDSEGKVIYLKERTLETNSGFGSGVAVSGDAKVDTAQYKLGRASARFDGTGDFISLANHPDFDFGQGDYTLETWVRPEGTDQMVMIDIGNAIGGGPGITLNLYGGNRIGIYSGGINRTVGFSYQTDGTRWYHMAVSRQNGILRYFVDGQLIYSEQNQDNLRSDRAIGVGAAINPSYRYFTKGYLDEVRVSKGIARWTENFTPPTEAYTADANTKLLLHFDG